MSNELFQQGYDDFFKGKSYKARREAEWLNGYAAAERISRNGWFNKQGRPDKIVNFTK